MTLLTEILIAVVPLLIVTTATAIYFNRRRSEKLYQRLFGFADDPQDEGAISEMNEKMKSIDANVKDLNHRRIDDIEGRLDTLQDGLESLESKFDTFGGDGDD